MLFIQILTQNIPSNLLKILIRYYFCQKTCAIAFSAILKACLCLGLKLRVLGKLLKASLPWLIPLFSTPDLPSKRSPTPCTQLPCRVNGQNAEQRWRDRPTRNVAATFGSKWRARRGNNNLCMRCGSSLAMLAEGVYWANCTPETAKCCALLLQLLLLLVTHKKWIWAAGAAAFVATGKRKLWPVPLCSSKPLGPPIIIPLKDLCCSRRLSRANLPTLTPFPYACSLAFVAKENTKNIAICN